MPGSTQKVRAPISRCRWMGSQTVIRPLIPNWRGSELGEAGRGVDTVQTSLWRLPDAVEAPAGAPAMWAGGVILSMAGP